MAAREVKLRLEQRLTPVTASAAPNADRADFASDAAAWREFCAGAREKGVSVPMIYPYSPEKEESLLAQIEELMGAEEGAAENLQWEPEWEEIVEAARAKGVDVPADIAEYSPENEEALFDLIEAKMLEDGVLVAAAEEPAAEPAAPKSELADPAAWREFCASAREKGLTIPMIYPYSPEREAAIREQLGEASEEAADEAPAEPEPPASPFADPAAWREFCASAREKGLTMPMIYPYSPEREADIREQLAGMGDAPEGAAAAAPPEAAAVDAVAAPPEAAAMDAVAAPADDVDSAATQALPEGWASGEIGDKTYYYQISDPETILWEPPATTTSPVQAQRAAPAATEPKPSKPTTAAEPRAAAAAEKAKPSAGFVARLRAIWSAVESYETPVSSLFDSD